MRLKVLRLCGTLAIAATLVCAAQQTQPDSAEPVFQSQSHLVLLPFRVRHGKNYVTGLTPSDVILLDNGKPRPFTIFDTPNSRAHLPVELVLLFDTTPRIENLWDPDEVFRFISDWDDGLSSAVLRQSADRIDVRISVYRCFGQTLYRSARPTTDPHAITNALRSILLPIPNPPDPAGLIALKLPPLRKNVPKGPFTEDYVTSYFIGAEGRGWTMEAAIGLLNEVSAAEDPVSRILIMFSEGIGATSTVPEDIGNQALDLGIPIYPIATNNMRHITSVDYPRNYFRMREFEALGKMTGGQGFEGPFVDARSLRSILDRVVNDVRAQYVVGFVPASGEGRTRRHELEVRLKSRSEGKIEGGKRRAVYQ